MMTIDIPEFEPRYIPIDLGAKGSFEVLIRPPDLAGEVGAFFADHVMANRVQQAVGGWRGLKDRSGIDVPFSPENLAAVGRAHPEIWPPIALAVHQFYPLPGKEDDTRKNSESLSSGSSGTAN